MFNTLSGTIGGIFIAAKDSKVLMKTAIVGSVTNIILNFVLIYYMGILGAALATAFSSIAIWALRYKESKKHLNLNINVRLFITQVIVLALQAASMTIIQSWYCYIAQIICLIFLLAMNKNMFNELINKLKVF